MNYSRRWKENCLLSFLYLRTTIFAENTSTCVEFLAREHVSLAFDVKNVLSRIQNDECRQDSRRSEENCEFLFSASQRMSALSRVPLRTAWWLAAAASRKRSSSLRESNSSLLYTVDDVLRWKNAKGKLRFGTQNLILKEENPFISFFRVPCRFFRRRLMNEKRKRKEGNGTTEDIRSPWGFGGNFPSLSYSMRHQIFIIHSRIFLIFKSMLLFRVVVCYSCHRQRNNVFYFTLKSLVFPRQPTMRVVVLDSTQIATWPGFFYVFFFLSFWQDRKSW